ncbi:hypothetical protein T484DRAFT_1766095, partial [Baffinella frigidus]
MSNSQLSVSNELMKLEVAANVQRRDAEKLEKKMCTDPLLGCLCPSTTAYPNATRNECRESLKDCFAGSTSASLIVAHNSFRLTVCASGKHYCDKGGTCVPNDSPCPAVKRGCPSTHPVRCASDWTCQKDKASCPDDDRCPDAGKRTLCPDGMTCAADTRSCSKLMSWEGCASGTQACPQMEGECGADAADCEKRTGCASAEFFCEHERSTSASLSVLVGVNNFPLSPSKGREPEYETKAVAKTQGERFQ